MDSKFPSESRTIKRIFDPLHREGGRRLFSIGGASGPIFGWEYDT